MEAAGRGRDRLTKLVIQLALCGPFSLIAGDEGPQDRDALTRSVRRYMPKVEEILDNPRVRRPTTCLQLLDLLI